MKYIEKTNNLIKEYFRILSVDYPEWLNDYIEIERMLKQQYISVTCGKIYAKLLFDYNDIEIQKNENKTNINWYIPTLVNSLQTLYK